MHAQEQIPSVEGSFQNWFFGGPVPQGPGHLWSRTPTLRLTKDRAVQQEAGKEAATTSPGALHGPMGEAQMLVKDAIFEDRHG